jgi:small subunit ribosomal protein S4
MRRLKKKYKRPKKPFDKERIEFERELIKKYGLKKKREIWKAEEILRKFRRMARKLAAKKDEKLKEELFDKLKKLGILENIKSTDDVLSLTVEDILKRRLQTVLYLKGLARTPKHARQLIVHGHVLINNRRVIFPSYLVPKEEEDKISVT